MRTIVVISALYLAALCMARGATRNLNESTRLMKIDRPRARTAFKWCLFFRVCEMVMFGLIVLLYVLGAAK